MVSRLAAVITGRLDVFLLSVVAGSAVVATYATGYQPATPLIMFGTAAGGVALPHFAGRLDGRSMRRTLVRCVRWLPVFFLASFIGAWAGFILLPMLFGATYRSARWIFVILVFGFAIQGWIQVRCVPAVRLAPGPRCRTPERDLSLGGRFARGRLDSGSWWGRCRPRHSCVVCPDASGYAPVAWRATAGDGKTESSTTTRCCRGAASVTLMHRMMRLAGVQSSLVRIMSRAT